MIDKQKADLHTSKQLLDCKCQSGGLEHAVYCVTAYKHFNLVR
jgi:hypothetical protein